jgi:hypothetical protein
MPTKRALSRQRDEADRLREEAKRTAPAAGTGPDQTAARLRQRLALSERARASLVDQITELRLCNDSLSRDAQDRAVAAEVAR